MWSLAVDGSTGTGLKIRKCAELVALLGQSEPYLSGL